MIKKFYICSLCLLIGQVLSAQKTIVGRSVPVQFSMMLTSENRKAETLKGAYEPVLDIINVDSLPEAVPVRPYSVAVIIGVEDYLFFPTAPFAARDAELMSRYFKTLLGVDRVILHTNKEVAGFFFDNLFDAEDGEVARVIVDGETDLFVFYSGHGIPSVGGDEMFMLPVDSKLKLVEKQGYSINKLFSQLAALPTRSTTLFIDACFSGFGKFSYADQPVNLARTKGIKVKPVVSQPWLDNPSFCVFTSCSGNEPSLVLDGSQTGLFTYFLATGIRGEADLDHDGNMTTGELFDYLLRHVSEASRKIYMEQTPAFYGSESRVLIRK